MNTGISKALRAGALHFSRAIALPVPALTRDGKLTSVPCHGTGCGEAEGLCG